MEAETGKETFAGGGQQLGNSRGVSGRKFPCHSPSFLGAPSFPGPLENVARSFTRIECVCLVVQSCPTACDHMDDSPPDSSVHGIL